MSGGGLGVGTWRRAVFRWVEGEHVCCEMKMASGCIEVVRRRGSRLGKPFHIPNAWMPQWFSLLKLVNFVSSLSFSQHAAGARRNGR